MSDQISVVMTTNRTWTAVSRLFQAYILNQHSRVIAFVPREDNEFLDIGQVNRRLSGLIY